MMIELVGADEVNEVQVEADKSVVAVMVAEETGSKAGRSSNDSRSRCS